ncbi:SulP family inorganic anion transporter, partial [Crocinitomicaceae bacterium]|nr:SulP family inorganic anion transporter [Crocinitomicaceae bacterium]
FILRRNYKNDYIAEEHVEEDHRCLKIKLPEELTFLNKASIFDLLDSIEEESNVEIDGSKCTFIDHDALEILKEFQNYTVKEKRIHLTVINVEPLKNIE